MNKWLTATALGVSLALGGCFQTTDPAQEDDGQDSASTAVKLSGVVYAPTGGDFEKVTMLENILNKVFGKPLYAALTGTSPLGAGTTVSLIDTTKTGDAAIIAQATTDDQGAYTLDAPEDFVAGPQYVIRAEGADGQTIETRITAEAAADSGDYSDIDVDPLTDVASQLVGEIASDATKIAELSTEELLLILDQVQKALANTEEDVSTLTKVSDIVAQLKAATLSDEETANVLYSTATSGTICGTVTGANDQGLDNIAVVARDYRDWVTRAMTKTDADGKYCLNVPVNGEAVNGETHNGEYILGAINRNGSTKDPDKHASEWWTTGGGKPLQWEGEKIALTSTDASLTKDFKLALGARIKGTVVDPNGNPLAGVGVIIRDHETWFPLFGSKTKEDGSFKANVPAGDYIVVARNKTRAPYATEVYADADNNGISDNVTVREEAEKITLTVGGGKTTDFKLTDGVLVYGEVLDDVDGNPVTGVRVRFDEANDLLGGFTTALRTNKDGKYKVWMPKKNYTIRSRGQLQAVDLSDSTILSGTNKNKYSLNFTDVVTHAQTTLMHGSSPVSQAVALLRDATTYDVVSQEISATDGVVDVYIADTSKNHILEIKIKEGESGAGGMIYVDQSSDSSAYTISRAAATVVTTATSVPSQINLPDGYKLSGSFTINGIAEGRGDVVIKTSANENFTKANTTLEGAYSAYLAAGSYKLIPKGSDSTAYTGDIANITIGTQDVTQDFAITTP